MTNPQCFKSDLAPAWSGAPGTPYATMHRVMSIRIPVPPNAPSDAFFRGMPAEVRDFLKSGFSQLATFPPRSLANIASRVNRWLDPAEPAPEIDALARKFKVDQPTMSAIVAAVTFQASALSAGIHPGPLEVFVTKATDAGILKREYAPKIQEFGDKYLVPRSAALSDALACANSSTDIIPSFLELETTIELRVAAFDDQRIVTVPIVIAALRTDVRDQKLIFQMTPRDVGQLLQKLEAITKKLDRSKVVKTQLVSRKGSK